MDCGHKEKDAKTDALMIRVKDHFEQNHGITDLDANQPLKKQIEQHVKRFESLLDVLNDTEERDELCERLRVSFKAGLSESGIKFDRASPSQVKTLYRYEPSKLDARGISYENIESKEKDILKEALREAKREKLSSIGTDGVGVEVGPRIVGIETGFVLVVSVKC
jgi:predicted small metal-binding protein